MNKLKLLSVRAEKLMLLLGYPKLWNCLWHGVLPAMEHTQSFTSHASKFDTIVDVGANRGQFSSFAAGRWPKARIICLEPLVEPRAKLQKILELVARGRSTVLGYAAGDKSEVVEMNIASRDHSSSILPIGEFQKQHYKMDVVGVEKISVRRLDELLDSVDLSNALLKIDVQGFEYQALVGCGQFLSNFAAVYIETSFVEFYDGMKLAPDIFDILENSGFKNMGSFNEDYKNGDILQADYLFFKM